MFVAHRAIEQEDILLDEGQQAAVGAQAEVADIAAVEQDAPGGGIVKAGHQVGDGGFSCAAAAHQGHHRAAGRRHVEVRAPPGGLGGTPRATLSKRASSTTAGASLAPGLSGLSSAMASNSKTRSMAASERCRSEKVLTMFHPDSAAGRCTTGRP